jgi:peptide/nickel transport system substrate-binding protein
MNSNTTANNRKLRWVLSLAILVTVLIVACGTAAPPTGGGDASQAQTEPTTAPTVAQPTELGIQATATPAPVATPTPATATDPGQVVSAKDTVRIVTSEEPTTIGAASPDCGGNIQNTICDDMVSDPLTWIDDRNNFQVVGLTGIETWEQLEPNRWRFKLRNGVTFHNGAPWNAEQAKFWIDYFGDEETSGHFNSNDFSFHGVISGEVVDPLTLDVVCKEACPILPRTTIFTKFQDVGWFETATEADIERMTVGLGPYKVVEWRQGVEVELEAFEDYKPNPSTVYSQAPSIQHVFQLWRNEPLVRASMLQAGEADWAEIASDNRDMVPKWKSATNNEAFIFSIDTVFHPELRKKEVREALNLAIDCETLMEQLYQGIMECYGNIAQPGTIGITPENSAPYPYDPERARQLLQQANYDPNNVIKVTMRSQRVAKDVEYAEAVVTYLREVGINAELNIVESSVWNNNARSNCGHMRTREEIMVAPGADLREKCQSLGPGAPNFSSMNLSLSATSTESLDFSRQSILRGSCFSRSSGVCFGDFEKMSEEAAATPTGPLREERMRAVADRVHNEFYFVPNFLVVTIYGMSENLEWEPTYAPRVRANTMTFTQ